MTAVMSVSEESGCVPRLWPGSVVKIKNTFVDVEMPEGYDELAVLQDCRRDVRSCPSKWTLSEVNPEQAQFDCQEISVNQASNPGTLDQACLAQSASKTSLASRQESSPAVEAEEAGTIEAVIHFRSP